MNDGREKHERSALDLGNRYHSVGDDRWTWPLVWDAEMIYLASPYSNDPEGNYAAMLDVCKRLVARAPAPLVFSPVVYFHPFCQKVPYDIVLSMCLQVLDKASEFCIVALPGWDESHGVDEETAFWYSKTRRIAFLMDPKTLLRAS